MESRDIYWAKYLKNKILDTFPNAIIKITTFDNIIETVFAAGFRPNKVLTFTLRDDFSVACITAIKKYSNASVIAYENEGLMNFDDELFINKRIGNSPRSLELIDLYYYWGKKPAKVSSEILLKKGFIKDINQVKFCGYINYEMSSEDIFNSLSPSEVSNYLEIKKICGNKKIILVLTAFALCEYEDKQFREDGEILSDNEDEIHNYAEKTRNKLKSYREKYVDFINYISSKYPDSMLIIKPHPAEYYTNGCIEYYKEKLKEKNIIVLDYPLLMGSLLSISNLVLHYGSTAALEAYIRNIPTVLFKDKDYAGNSDLFFSTLTIYSNKMDDFNMDLPFIRFEKNDKLLMELFNYSFKENYQPSKDLIRALLEKNSKKNFNKIKLSKEEYKVNIMFDYILMSLKKELIRFHLIRSFRLIKCLVRIIN